MYPLKDWKKYKRGYKFLEPTFYSKHHLGLDIICPTGTKLIAWTKIKVKAVYGKQGGNQAHVYADGKLFRFLHLKSLPKPGEYKEGQTFAITNNTGTSTGSHVHEDISKNGKLELNNLKNFIDPEKYHKEWHQDHKKKDKKGDKKKDSTPKQDEVVKVPVTVVKESTVKPEMPPVSAPKVETIPEVIPAPKPPQNSIFNQIINWLYSALIK